MSDASDAERAQLIDIRFGQMWDRHAELKMRAIMDKYITELAEFEKTQDRTSARLPTFHHSTPEHPNRKKSAFEIAFGL